MRNRVVWCLLCVWLAWPAAGQPPILYGIRGNGDLVWINPATGAATPVGSSGLESNAIAAFVQDTGRFGSHIDQLLTGGGPQADRINRVDRWTGSAFGFTTITGMPAGYGVRGMVMAPYTFAPIYAILGADDPTAIDLFATISGDICSIIGPTGRSDLDAIARSPAGALYALGTSGGGGLYSLDGTGTPTLIGGGGFGSDNRALAFLPDGRLLACRDNLLLVNPATGATTLIGPTGVTDIRGLAVDLACYGNCYPEGPPPTLNALDFGCFLNRFAAGDPYCNCDGSTTPPALNVADFSCFLNAFAAGCP